MITHMDLSRQGALLSGEYSADKGVDRFEFMFKSVPGSKNLVINFHPAYGIDSLKSMPRFYPVPTDENLLSVSDNFFRRIKIEPTEAFHTSKRRISVAGWFLHLQTVLPGLIRRLKEIHGFEKVIMLGGSSGGFAALYYSFFLEDSVAIAFNPQTDIAYNLRGLAALGITLGDISDKCTDLNTLYRGGFTNKVIYVVNNMSLADMQRHTLPFIAGIHNENVILKADFWGTHNHSGSIPPEEYSLWIKAVCAAKSTAVTDISDAYYQLKKGGGDAK